jgi:LacI family transcriptional regulator
LISSLELSRICGVSQGTVDRALHDRPGISEKTKRRILAAAAKHGYRPHPAARELLTGDRRMVGAVVPGVNSIFFMNLVDAIRVELRDDGYRIFVAPYTGEDEFLDVLDDLAARRARAVFAVPPKDGVRVPDHISRMTTVISLTNSMRGTGVRALTPDEVATGRDAADYLASKGHTELLHLTYVRNVAAIRARARGFMARARERGLRASTLRPPDERRMLEAIERRGVTAVFCHNDWLALNAIRSLEAAGMRVPEDVSVIGVDDAPDFVSIYPDLTTMHYPAEEIARAAKSILAEKTPKDIGRLSVVERKTVASRS